MKRKGGKVLRIRPFNMANFSGAGGYIPVYVMTGSIVSFPATLWLWAGFAATIKDENGRLNFGVLGRRLKWVLLPICCVSIIPWIAIMISQLSYYGGNPASWVPAIAWAAFLHNIGVYIAIYRSAKKLNEKDLLSKGMWFRSTFMHGVMIAIVGFFVSLLLVGFGS